MAFSFNVFLLLIFAAAAVLFSSASTSYPESYLCTPGWSYLPTTGACYGVNVLPPRPSWDASEAYCKQSVAHIATFLSKEEFDHILSYYFVSWDYIWLGFYSMDQGQTWKSVDGKDIDPFKYANWCGNGYPLKFAGKHCLGIGAFNETICLHNHDCHAFTMRIVCKKQIF